MAQFARPDTDADNTGAYTDQGGGSTTIYTTIDESSASDADYIRTPAGAGTYVYTARLSDVTDPVSGPQVTYFSSPFRTLLHKDYL